MFNWFCFVWNKSIWVYTTNMLSTVTTVAIWLGDGKTEDMQKKNLQYRGVLSNATEQLRREKKKKKNQVSSEAQFCIMIQQYRHPASSCSHKDKILLANGAVVTTRFVETQPDKQGHHDKIGAKWFQTCHSMKLNSRHTINPFRYAPCNYSSVQSAQWQFWI